MAEVGGVKPFRSHAEALRSAHRFTEESNRRLRQMEDDFRQREIRPAYVGADGEPVWVFPIAAPDA